MNRYRASNRDKVLSAGLAVGATVGITGLLGYEIVNQKVAQVEAISQQVIATPDGLTAQDLHGWQAQLDSQQQKLDSYRAKLVALKTKIDSTAQKVSVIPIIQKVATPTASRVTKPKATVAKPQSNTKGSAHREHENEHEDD